HVVSRRDARLPGARHGPPVVGRRVGCCAAPADWRRSARPAGDDGPFSADSRRRAASLYLDPRRRRGGRRSAPAQAAVSEYAVLDRAPLPLLRRLVSALAPAP